ncbi:hypothetical protein KKJ06_19855 [Xenorhabdus bovienii]|uniref:hypothetical protein n=2 Tax=Xenorhabdus bovienii TaxID=40576 RepID=UPI0023B2DA1E|nr:hypothetical protein [Xenorhabdus bovienii]MDE9545062.1 hypothetical protein [Xenorhabdus bovienii]MDE9553200.1 hypothetical protein [Xenorhabdus bovienii]MDE9557612.1 hypothetical protein [Xenorhabdus bovienii]
MTKPNYEAIGRCKFLKEEIVKLLSQRSGCINKLNDEIMHLNEYTYLRTGFIPKFDINYMHKLLERITAVDNELVQTVNEFNSYCQDAGEPPIEFRLSPRNSDCEYGRADVVIGTD